MHRLFYISTAIPGVSDTDVDAIANRARERNEDRGITGILGFNGMNFAQVLEGQREAVETLMEEIRQDERHSGVIVVSEKPVETRAFGKWGMRRVDGLNFDEFVDSMTR